MTAQTARAVTGIALLLSALGTVDFARAEAQDAAGPSALPAEVGWSDVLRLVRSRSPELAALRDQLRVARSEVALAGVLPNPSLDYTGYKRIGHGDQYNTQHQLGLATPLWLAGQRAARVRAAERRAQLAQAEGAVDAHDLQTRALLDWLALLAAQQRVDVLEQAHAEIADMSRIVHERVDAGAQSPYDAAKVELEAAELATREAGAHADQVALSAGLAQLVGAPEWRPRARGEFAALGIDGTFAELWRTASHALPSLTAAARRNEAAASEIEVARAERWPVPTLSLGTLLTTDNRSAALYVGLSTPLPLLDFGGAAIDRSQAALVAADSERRAALALARTALAANLASLAAKRATLAGYEQNVRSRLPGLREMARAAYAAGRGSVLDLLDSLRSGIDLSLEHVDLTHQVIAAELETLASAGVLGPASPGSAP